VCALRNQRRIGGAGCHATPLSSSSWTPHHTCGVLLFDTCAKGHLHG
jgi:hypothetical protein